MHVVLAHHSLHDPDLKGFTRLSYQFSNSLRYFSIQYLVSILRHPDKVILNLKHLVATVPVFHAAPPSCSIFSQLKLTG